MGTTTQVQHLVAAVEQLRSEVTELRSRLAVAEAKAERDEANARITTGSPQNARLTDELVGASAGRPGAGCDEASDGGDGPAIRRRGMLLGLGAAGAGAVAATVAGTASPAAAADNGPLLIGALNNGTNSTRLTSTGPGMLVLSSSESAEYGLWVLRSSATSSQPAIVAEVTKSGDAVRGRALNTAELNSGVGIHGINEGGGSAAVFERLTTGPGTFPAVGVFDYGSGVALQASSQAGTGVVAEGDHAPLRIIGIDSGIPTTGAHQRGEVRLSEDTGEWFYCVTSATPGTWRRGTMAAPGYNNAQAGSVGSSGSMNLMATPFRLFDSRPGQPVPLGGGGKIVPGTNVSVQVTGTTPTGGGQKVPAGAVGVLATLTVTSTSGTGGFLKAFPTGVTVPNTSVLNWFGTDQNLATTTVIRLSSAGKFDLRTGTNSSHVIVDVVGFLF